MEERHVYLLNDSFPPIIDGVANAVVNYASELQAFGESPVVLAPKMAGSDDSVFPYPVLRYPSIDITKKIGYYVGVPLSAKLSNFARKNPPAILHAHCPTVSLLLGRSLRMEYRVPLVYTYHTKYDIDIRKAISGKFIQEALIRAMVETISAADEVWAVSRGAGENLKALGYQGDVIVMNNGVDLPKGRVGEEKVRALREEYGLNDGAPVFLFVGRMEWYKNQKLIMDALKLLKAAGRRFHMFFIGKGIQEEEIRKYAAEAGIESECVFTGAVSDRERLRTFYAAADLFLFPSTYDTNGLVVREAAASSLAAVLVRGSCAAEDTEDGRNAFLIDETAESMFALLNDLCDRPEVMRSVGERAAEELYVSWHDAVASARERYGIIEEEYTAGHYRRKNLSGQTIRMRRRLSEVFEKAERTPKENRKEEERK